MLFDPAIVGIATILGAISTAVYTVFTMLLWYLNRGMLLAMKAQQQTLADQIQLQRAQNRSLAYHAIVSSHREVLDLLLRADGLSVIAPVGTSVEHMKNQLMMTMLINHCHAIFVDYRSAIVDTQQWNGFVRDAADMFSAPALRERWLEVEEYYSPTFRAFVRDHLHVR